MKKDDKSTFNNNQIRFKQEDIKENRINGMVGVGNNKNYFEIKQEDFSTSNSNAFNNIIKRTIHKEDTKDKLEQYLNINNNTLIKINNSYDTASKTLYGNWKMKTDNYNTGKYDPALNLYYFTTFVIPKNIPEENLRLYKEDGSITNYNKSNKVKETKSAKFITRIATDDKGYFEQNSLNELEYYINPFFENKPFEIIKDIINDIKFNNKNIKGINVIEDRPKTLYTIIDNIVYIEITEQDKENFYLDVRNFLNYATNEGYEQEFNITLNNTKMNKIDFLNVINTLSTAELYSIMLNLLVDDNNPYDNQEFVIYNIETPPEDLLISNNRNGENFEGRRVIDWDGNSSQYNITTTLIKGDTTNILDNNNVVMEEHSKKITAKNNKTTPITSPTTLYTKLYVGRIPEAQTEKQDKELTLNDFKILLTENFNFNIDDYTATENINKTALNSIINALKDGATETQIKNIFKAFKTTYTPELLIKILLNQSIADFNYITIKPIRYKEMEDTTIINNKATNVIMGDWKTIPNGANLNDIKVKAGTIIEYEIIYTLPNSNTINSTWDYINKYAGNYFKDRQDYLTDYDDIISNLLNFTLVPSTVKEGNIYKVSDKYLQANPNLLNDYTTEFFNLGSGRNLFFTKVEIVDEDGKTVYNSDISMSTRVFNVNLDGDLLKDDKDLFVKAYVKYENNENTSMPTHNSNIKINASNNYYSNIITEEVEGNIKGKMNHGDENKHETKENILTIPITKDILNKSIEQEIRLNIPNSIDNTIHNDAETIIIKVNPNLKDNEITDIILFKDNYGNSKTFGNISRSNYNNGSTGNKQELSKNLNEKYYAVVKVKRNKGNMEEKYGNLYVEVSYRNQTSKFDTLIDDVKEFTQPNITQDGAVALKEFDAEGEYMYYGFPISAPDITNLTIKAEYRVGNKIDNKYIDNEDGNITNNVWSENWGTGFNFFVSDLQAPSNMSYDEKKGSTEDIEVSMNFIAGLDADDSIYDNGTRTVSLNIYQQKVDGQGAGAKVYPKEVKGGDKYLGNGILQINFAGSFKTNITANFDKQKFTEGYYLYYADINKKPILPNIYENNLTDNEISDRMNVFKFMEAENDKIICREPWTYNEWRVQFRWSNYEYSNPRYYHYQQPIYDSEGRYQGSVDRCGCSCGNRSGSDNGKTNWGPDGNGSLYWERHSIQIWLWSSGKGGKNTKLVDTKTGFKSSGEVRTGESFYVYFKTIHESNRDTLPNAPSGRSPFAETYDTHVGPCDYLRRSPNVSNVIGPRQARINITGISYGVYKSYTPSSTEKSTPTNKTYVFKPLPTVQVPITNKNQTINYSIETYSYDGHRYDTCHPRKQLCTSASTTVKIVPSIIIVGGEETDNNTGQDTGIWME